MEYNYPTFGTLQTTLCGQVMSELRNLRRAVGLKQEAFAAVQMKALRTWDSGRCLVPPKILKRAKQVVTDWRREQSGGVSVGVTQANAVTRLLETR